MVDTFLGCHHAKPCCGQTRHFCPTEDCWKGGLARQRRWRLYSRGSLTLGDNRTSIACLCPEAGRRRRRAQVCRWGRTLPRSCMREQIRANLPSCNAH
ncbi:hypothetical protein PF008_g27698 [Phytophthora fragariae]|uniref:Uncharacterized protein n=1 Tax=Phytophthora fragariae TaxID=53985 RepID=A0A6G0QDG1_9STRA|nr:hypothetical protein PF008_g27698 [Phytophthora fragariae]